MRKTQWVHRVLKLEPFDEPVFQRGAFLSGPISVVRSLGLHQYRRGRERGQELARKKILKGETITVAILTVAAEPSCMREC